MELFLFISGIGNIEDICSCFACSIAETPREHKSRVAYFSGAVAGSGEPLISYHNHEFLDDRKEGSVSTARSSNNDGYVKRRKEIRVIPEIGNNRVVSSTTQTLTFEACRIKC